MKFTKLILLAVIAVTVCGCEKEIPSEPTTPTQKAPAGETRTVTSILSFDSVEAMEQQVYNLMRMQPEEQAIWYAKHNFESQYSALYRAAREIDEAANLNEAEAIKAKYTPFFLYNANPADEEMFNPYLPNENPNYAFVCNIDGEVRIGGEVVNFNTIKAVEETHEYQLTHATETRAAEMRPNYLYSEVGDRKFWAEAGIYTGNQGEGYANRLVMIQFTAHAKNIFGWNKYTTAYFIRSDSYGYWRLLSSYFEAKFLLNKKGDWTADYSSPTFVEVGYPQPYMRADMRLWIYSRGTGEAGLGILNISL